MREKGFKKKNLPLDNRQTSGYITKRIGGLTFESCCIKRIRSLCTNAIRNYFEQERVYHEHLDCLDVELDDGSKLENDLVIVSTGVSPNKAIAAEVGLECGPRGHIVVDEHLRTSDPDIYAAGDAVEVVKSIGITLFI